ncbi:MAG: response regulator [Bacteroidetes bacterium]|nr:response regulator [Bacteroidota bacterium]
MSTTTKTPILLIEDNPGDVTLVKIYLPDSSMRYKLFTAETLYEGLEIIQSKEIAITLLDLSLPDSTGFKTLIRYLEKAPQTPVIVLTGTNNEIIGNQAVKAGAQDFLVKDQFDGKILGRSIRYSLQRFKIQIKLEETATKLSLSEKRNLEAQEMAKFGDWEMDIVTNQMKWTNEVFRIFGFQPNSMNPTLSDYLNYVQIEDREEVEAFFEKAIKDGKLHRLEHRIIVEGHITKHLTIQAKIYYEEINNKLMLVGAIQDITERKLAEKLIIEKNISSKTSKIKEEVLSDMGFHIRTPLSSVINLLFSLENSTISTQQKEYIEGLKSSVDELSIYINNLLNFSLLVNENIKVEKEEFNIRDLILSLERTVRIKAENAHINLQFNLSKTFPKKIISDSQKVTQIFYNLVNNAIKYNSRKGKVIIDIWSIKTEGSRAILNFSILDTGQGMSFEQIKELENSEELLKIYTDEKEVSQKRQIGIAIVSKLAKMLDGSLSIKSKGGEESTFFVEIPIEIPKSNQFRIGDKPESPIKILMIEDNGLNRLSTRKVLESWSEYVTVDEAENGLIGVEKFREYGYDLILMDIQMPVMNGLQATQKIRENSQVPIIALTATASKQEQDRCFEIGINDYLSKPFKPEELRSKILNSMQLFEAGVIGSQSKHSNEF